MSDFDVESFDTPGGGKIVFFPNEEGFIMFGPDNSQTRPVRDILVFHPLSDDNRYVFLHKIWEELSCLGEGLINSDNTAMIEYGHGLDSVSKMIACVVAQKDYFERDIILMLTPPMFATDSFLVKTSDGLIYIGPNDGSLGFITHESIVEMRRLAESTLSYRIFAAAKIVAGWDWDLFSAKINKDLLVTVNFGRA